MSTSSMQVSSTQARQGYAHKVFHVVITILFSHLYLENLPKKMCKMKIRKLELWLQS